MLAISIIHNLQTRSVDFTLAFPQADLDEEVFMILPAGVDHEDSTNKYVLKLNKSLYGLKQAARNWFQCLSSALKLRGLSPATRDSCVFLGHKMIVIIYVDDCLIFTPQNSTSSDRLIASLEKGNENFQFTDQGSLSSYLGMEITRKGNTISMVQPIVQVKNHQNLYSCNCDEIQQLSKQKATT